MNLIRYSPSSLDLLDNVSSWFDDMLVGPVFGKSTVPAVDVKETDSEFLMEVELPGLSEKDVEVKLDNNLLTISSRKEDKKEEKKNGYIMRERRSASFSRSLRSSRGDRQGKDCRGVQGRRPQPELPQDTGCETQDHRSKKELTDRFVGGACRAALLKKSVQAARGRRGTSGFFYFTNVRNFAYAFSQVSRSRGANSRMGNAARIMALASESSG